MGGLTEQPCTEGFEILGYQKSWQILVLVIVTILNRISKKPHLKIHPLHSSRIWMALDSCDSEK